ncbi:MAG: guanine deaminase [Devosia sp.]|nr:guanine deaminase [Devosia sp.]
MQSLAGRTIRASACHAPVRGQLDYLDDALIVIGTDGRIGHVLRQADPEYEAALGIAEQQETLVSLPPATVLLPGFVDLHIHAPQYAQLGQALDVPLEIWLGKYTFPLEARYADLDFARPRYEALVGDLLANGTTTAVYFATIHQDATRLLADICLDKGQRALVGKVAMDDPQGCPDYYSDVSAEAAVADTRALIDYIRSHPGNAAGRVRPVITPRFIPSCTDAALEGLGALAAECDCHVQTHCSESDWAHGYGLARFGETDTASLDRFGLLTRKTVLAHSNFITGADMDRLATRGAGVAHCALSNAYFAGAAFPLRAALARGVHVGLGTDISGGPGASMLEAQRMAVVTSRLLESGVDPDLDVAERGRPASRIDMATAFHLATAGGGEVLDLPIGRFEPGCHFDAIAVDTAAPEGGIRLFEELPPLDLLEKLINTASRANIAAVWVDGRLVAGTA